MGGINVIGGNSNVTISDFTPLWRNISFEFFGGWLLGSDYRHE